MKKAKPSAAAAAADDDDAAAPAKPRTVSAWEAFCKDRRPMLISEQPELKFGEIGKARVFTFTALCLA